MGATNIQIPRDCMPPCVFIVMAVFRPDPARLREQLHSIAAQSHDHLHLVAVIADTRSDALVTRLAEEAGLACTLLPCTAELDAVRAFEAGLTRAMTLIDTAIDTGLDMGTDAKDPAPLIALADQDDIWHPDRLARGVAVLTQSGAALVHSDARLVGADGTTVLHHSMFACEKRHKRPGLRGLLYRNNITGMTCLMRPALLRLALPFPPQSGVHFYHDLWLGLLAAATGGVQLIEAPLVDYRQHADNVVGAVDRRTRPAKTGRLPPLMWLRREAAAYGLARYLAQATQHRLAEAIADGRLTEATVTTRPLRPFVQRLRGAGAHLWDATRLGLSGHFRLARIAAGFAIVNMARLIWSLRETMKDGFAKTLGSFDAKLYSLSPGVEPPQGPDTPDIPDKPTPHENLIDTRKEPAWTPVFSADTPALTVLVPTLNPTEVFAGIVTALDIGLGLAARGHHVRFVATDLPISSPEVSLRFLQSRLTPHATAAGAGGRVSVHCGLSTPALPAHRDDVFMATAWWSAHVAEKLIRRHGFTRQTFLYLIQDYEPNFYAWGPEFADARASYDFNFIPVFNTTLLRDYFHEQGYGFAGPDALAFHPSINIDRYASGAHTGRPGGPRRLAVYGRPEVARNMYTTAIEALARFITREGLGPQEIELVSIGLSHAPVTLPGGLVLNSLGKLPWGDYPDYLRSIDVGLALMYSPHPSHLPLEMAAAGVQVVTNEFGPKDLSMMSRAIRSTQAHAPAVADALSDAWHADKPTPQDRRIDLTRLGQDIGQMTDRLSARLTPLIGAIENKTGTE